MSPSAPLPLSNPTPPLSPKPPKKPSSPTPPPQKPQPKKRRRSALQVAQERLELLEENRDLRKKQEEMLVEFDKLKERMVKLESVLGDKDRVLKRYRRNLIGFIEGSEGGVLVERSGDYGEGEGEERKGEKVGEGGFGREVSLGSFDRDGGNRFEFDGFKGFKGERREVADGDTESSSGSDGSEYSAPVLKAEDRVFGVNGLVDSGNGVRKYRRRKPSVWTPKEEAMFMRAYHIHGCRWKDIQNMLPHKTRQQIQSHGSYLIKQGRLQKKNSRLWTRREQSATLPNTPEEGQQDQDRNHDRSVKNNEEESPDARGEMNFSSHHGHRNNVEGVDHEDRKYKDRDGYHPQANYGKAEDDRDDDAALMSDDVALVKGSPRSNADVDTEEEE